MGMLGMIGSMLGGLIGGGKPKAETPAPNFGQFGGQPNAPKKSAAKKALISSSKSGVLGEPTTGRGKLFGN